MSVAKKRFTIKDEADSKQHLTLFASVKVIFFILFLALVPVLFYNPDVSFGPFDVFRRDFFKTEIILSGEKYDSDGLVSAIRGMDFKTVKLFVRSGFNLNDLDSQGNLPLCVAAETGSLDMVDILLQGDVNLVKRNLSNNLTPLFCAIKGNNIQIIDKFVNSGISINTRNENSKGISPIHYAAALGRDNVISHLIKLGADVNVTNLDGQTPLHNAVLQDNIVVLYMLLNSGAKVDVVDKYGETPLSLAISNGNDLYVALLKRYLKADASTSLNNLAV